MLEYDQPNPSHVRPPGSATPHIEPVKCSVSELVKFGQHPPEDEDPQQQHPQDDVDDNGTDALEIGSGIFSYQDTTKQPFTMHRVPLVTTSEPLTH
jgi:hypothetical protein